MSSRSPQETVGGRGILDEAALARVLQRARSMLRDWRRRGEGPPIVAMLQPSQARLWSGVVRNCLVTGLREEAWRQTAIYGSTICDPRSAAKLCGKCIRTQPLSASERANDPWRDRSLEPALKEYYGEVYRLPGDPAQQYFLFTYQLAYCPKEKAIRKGGVGLYSPAFELFADESALLNCAREDLGSDWPGFLRRHMQPLIDEGVVAAITIDAAESPVVLLEEPPRVEQDSADQGAFDLTGRAPAPEATVSEEVEKGPLCPDSASDEESSDSSRMNEVTSLDKLSSDSAQPPVLKEALSTIERTFAPTSATVVAQGLSLIEGGPGVAPHKGEATPQEITASTPPREDQDGLNPGDGGETPRRPLQSKVSRVEGLETEGAPTRAAEDETGPAKNAPNLSAEALARVEQSIEEAKQRTISELRDYQDLTLLGRSQKQDRIMTEVEEFYRCRKAGRITFLSLHFDVFHMIARRDVASYKREHGMDALRRSPDDFARFGAAARQAVAEANAIYRLEDWLSERLGRSILPHHGGAGDESLVEAEGADGWYDADYIYLHRSRLVAALGAPFEEQEAIRLLEDNEILVPAKLKRRFWGGQAQTEPTAYVVLRRAGLHLLATAVVPSSQAL